jgi:hypothetical protein
VRGGHFARTRGQCVPGATLCARLWVTAPAGAHARWGDQIAIASYLAEATPEVLTW